MFEPLSLVLARQTPGLLDAGRHRVKPYSREKLIREYRTAFATGQRVKAFLMAEALTAENIPPCFRFAHPPSPRPLNLNQQSDLFTHDIQWLAKRHPAQRNKVKGERYKRLFDDLVAPAEFEWSKGGGDVSRANNLEWLREVEYWFDSGKRNVWPIVRGLQLSERQEWECKWLRSQIVTKKADALTERRDTVYEAIMRHRLTTERGMDAEAAKAVLVHRHRVWLCAQMTRDGTKVSPAAAARLYEMWTEKKIDRGTVGQALKWVKSNVPEAGNRGHGGARKSDIAISNL